MLSYRRQFGDGSIENEMGMCFTKVNSDERITRKARQKYLTNDGVFCAFESKGQNYGREDSTAALEKRRRHEDCAGEKCHLSSHRVEEGKILTKCGFC